MKAIWSRTAQTKPCSCSPCVHGTAVLARRSTTAASGRRLKAGDIFTACYTGIFAAAAVADAKIKQDRRDQWERAIAKAKAEDHYINNEPEEPPRRAQMLMRKVASSFTRAGISSVDIVPPSGHNVVNTQLKALKRRIQSPRQEEAEGMTEWTSARPTYRDAEAAASELQQDREPQSRVHLDKLEEMVSKLIVRLLVALQPKENMDISRRTSNECIQPEASQLAAKVEALQSGPSPLPAFQPVDINGLYREERFALNRSILDALSKAPATQSVDLAVAKLCYNLLVSTSPPNVQTYTIMIEQLTKLKQHRAAKAVIDSFFEDSVFRPKDPTICAILNHFIEAGDETGFQGIIRRMNCTDGNMRIKKRPLSALGNPKVLAWALTSKVKNRCGYLHEKVTRNVGIYLVLIDGCLRFSRIQQAITYFRAAHNDGFDLPENVLGNLIEHCISSHDRRSATILLQTVIRRGKSVLDWSRGLRSYVYRLMDFCGIEFDIENNTYLDRALPIHWKSFEVVWRSMSISRVESAIDSIAANIGALKTTVQSAPSGFPDLLNVLLTQIEQNLESEASRVHKAKITQVETKLAHCVALSIEQNAEVSKTCDVLGLPRPPSCLTRRHPFVFRLKLNLNSIHTPQVKQSDVSHLRALCPARTSQSEEHAEPSMDSKDVTASRYQEAKWNFENRRDLESQDLEYVEDQEFQNMSFQASASGDSKYPLTSPATEPRPGDAGATSLVTKDIPFFEYRHGILGKVACRRHPEFPRLDISQN